MKRLLILIFLASAALFAQSDLKFVTYGSKSDPKEGDDNHIQVINIKLPEDYKGKAFLRLFDMSCGSVHDLRFGQWDSRFRFSLYKNEHKEIEFTNVAGYAAKVNDQILSHFETGIDDRYYDKWYTFYDLNSAGRDNPVFSLVVQGVEGDDANNFGMFVSSDSLENKSIEGVRVYSYEPTIPFVRSSSVFSFKVMPGKDTDLTFQLFDFDGTRAGISSLIKDSQLLGYSNAQNWPGVKVPLEVFENENYCTLDIGPEKNLFNDVTFRIIGSKGNSLPIELPAFEKEASSIPEAVRQITYPDCNSVAVDYSGSRSKNGGVLNYKWIVDDKEITAGEKTTNSFDSAGKYNIKTLIEEQNELITRAKLDIYQVVVNSQPVAKIDSIKVGAPNKPLLFDASNSFDKDGSVKKYQWWFGDGFTGSGSKTSHSYSAPGRFVVKLMIWDDSDIGCNSDTDSAVVIINDSPKAITPQEIYYAAVGQVINFDASKSYDPDGKIVSARWNFWGLGVKEGLVVENSFSEPGTYPILLTVRDNSAVENSESVLKLKAIINSPPKANAGISRICKEGESVRFDGSKSGDLDGRIKDYSWDFGDGEKAEGKIVDHIFTKQGIYTVKLKVTDDSGMTNDYATDSVSVAVNRILRHEFNEKINSAVGSANFDGTRQFIVDGVESRYLWNFGDGNTGEGKNVTHNYKTPGTYNVILKVTDNIKNQNFEYLDTIQVVIDRRPIADAGPDYTVAPGQTLSFDNSKSVDSDGRIVKTKWFIDNILISEQNRFDYKFERPGKYIVSLEVTDDFETPLTGVDNCVVTVNSAPVTKINCSLKTVPNEKIRFDASKSYDSDGTITEYSWTFSDGETRSGKNVEKSFRTPGLFSAILKIKDDSKAINSITMDTVVVKVNNPPVIKTQEYIETCSSTVLLDASASSDPDGDPVTFKWSFPGEQERAGSGVTVHNFSEYGIIPVVLTADDGMGLSNSLVRKTITVNLHKPPVANAGPDTTVCAGEIVILSGLKSQAADNSSLEYQWTFDDSTKLTGSNVFRVFKKGGLYRVVLRVRDNSGLECNTGIDTKIIKVIGAPIANAGPDIEACANSPVEFDGSKSTDVDGIVNSYEWDFGDGESGGGVNPTHIYKKPGTYKATLTITGDMRGECDNTSRDDLSVTVVEAPIASFAARDSIPDNYQTTFDASLSSTSSGNIIGYEWDFGDSTKADGKIVKHEYKKFGSYYVTLKIFTDLKNRCNSSMVSKSVYVNGKPTAVAESKSKAAVYETVIFSGIKSSDPDGQISEYKWDFGDGNRAEGVETAHAFSEPGKYKVSLSVKDETSTENNADKQIVEVIVNEGPAAKFELPEFAYVNEEITLDASGSSDNDGKISSFEWFADDATLSGDAVFNAKFVSPGMKKIRLVVKDNSMQINNAQEKTGYIRIVDYPEITLPDSVIACINERVDLNPEITNLYDASGIIYYWTSDADNNTYKEKSISVKIISTGEKNYHLELIDKKGKVLAHALTKIIVKNSPALGPAEDINLSIGSANDEYLFNASEYYKGNLSFLKINWSFGDGSSSNLPVVLHKYPKEGRFKAELEVDDQQNTPCSRAKISFFVNVLKK